MRFLSQKWVVWLLTGTVLASLALLAAGIGSLELRPGVGLLLSSTGPLQAGGKSPDQSPLALLYTIIALMMFLLPVSFLVVLLSPAARRTFLTQAAKIVVSLLLLAAVSWIVGTQTGPDLDGLAAPRSDISLETGVENAESLALPPDQSPFWLGGALSLGLAALALWFGLRWWSGRQADQASTSDDSMAQAAQAALEALRQGEGLQSVILRCYTQMLSVASAARKVERAEYLTAREFEQSLIEVGLPAADVDTLTQLFEFARYGSEAPTPLQEQQAIACLSALTEALARPQTEGA